MTEGPEGHPLGEEFEDLADHRQAAAPATIDLDWLQDECERLERILRLQHADPEDPEDEGQLPPRDELELARRPADTTTGALRRWAYLKHCYLKRSQDLAQRGDEASETALDAIRRLITREPVEVDLQNGRTVQVSDRSWSALYEIARHGKRIQRLHQDTERLDDLEGRVIDRIDEQGRTPALRRRLLWIRDLYEQVTEELKLHRKAIYAHLTTADGAPAEGLEAAPDWWREATPLDDMLLVAAVHHVGPDLYQRLGEMPDPPERDTDSEWIDLENFGWMTAFKRWDKKMPVESAPCENRPMGQLLATVRAGTDPVLDPGD